MIINLEGLAARLTTALYGDTEMDELELARIEYGFSLTLGIGLGLAICLLLALVLGTFNTALLLIIPALVVRIFSGGAHCSSYDRCLFFSVLVFVPVSVLVKFLAAVLAPTTLVYVYWGLILSVLVYLLAANRRALLPAVGVNAAAAGAVLVFGGALSARILLPVAAGVFIQTVMLSKAGEWLVVKSDAVLKRVGI